MDSTKTVIQNVMQSDAYKNLLAVLSGETTATDDDGVHSVTVTDEERAQRVAAFDDDATKAALNRLQDGLQASGRKDVLGHVVLIRTGVTPLQAVLGDAEGGFSQARMLARNLVMSAMRKAQAGAVYAEANKAPSAGADLRAGINLPPIIGADAVPSHFERQNHDAMMRARGWVPVSDGA